MTNLADQLSRTMVNALREAEYAEWFLPFFVVVCGANGGMMTGAFRDDGKGEAEFIQRSQDKDITMPLNVILVDTRGKALRVVCEEGLFRPSLKEFLN